MDNKPNSPAPAPSTSAPASAMAASPVSQPTDPAKTRKIIKIVAIASGAFVLFLVGLGVLINLLIVDYGESYDLARVLKVRLSELVPSSDCENVVDYVSRPTVSETKYENYISACRESAKNDDDIIYRLGETEGVRRDSEIRAQFESFKDAYDAAFSDNNDFEKKLDAYKSWHSFLYQKYKLTISNSEDDYKKAAEYAKATGNDTLAKYGEEWLKLALAYRSAYHAYWDDAKAGDNQYRALTTARSALQEYVRDNEPDIEDEIPLELSDTAKVYREFNKLYDLISGNTFYEYRDYDDNDLWWTIDS